MGEAAEPRRPIRPGTRLPRQVWKVAILAGAGSYLDGAAMVSTGIALVMYQEALGLGPGEIGLISGLLVLSFAIGAMIGGRLGDRIGRKRVFVLTLFLVVVGAVLMAAATAPWMLVVGVVILGFGVGADQPAALAMISEEAPAGAKSRLVAFSMVLWLVASIVTIVLVMLFGNLGVTAGRILYAHVAIVTVVVLLFRLTLPESREWQKARRADLEVERAGGARPVGTSVKSLVSGPYMQAFIGTGLFYALVNLTANTGGQYTAYMWVNLAGQSVEFASLVGFVTMIFSFAVSIVFMRIVERPSRMAWFAAGAILYALGPFAPIALGVNVPSLIVFSTFSGVGAAFAGETIYKVWTQELFPTLLRSSAQGATIAFARFVAAAFSVVTPVILSVNASALFGTLAIIAAISGVMGMFWLARLPTVNEATADEQLFDEPITAAGESDARR